MISFCSNFPRKVAIKSSNFPPQITSRCISPSSSSPLFFSPSLRPMNRRISSLFRTRYVLDSITSTPVLSCRYLVAYSIRIIPLFIPRGSLACRGDETVRGMKRRLNTSISNSSRYSSTFDELHSQENWKMDNWKKYGSPHSTVTFSKVRQSSIYGCPNSITYSQLLHWLNSWHIIFTPVFTVVRCSQCPRCLTGNIFHLKLLQAIRANGTTPAVVYTLSVVKDYNFTILICFIYSILLLRCRFSYCHGENRSGCADLCRTLDICIYIYYLSIQSP